jgi:hypothetical protein
MADLLSGTVMVIDNTNGAQIGNTWNLAGMTNTHYPAWNANVNWLLAPNVSYSAWAHRHRWNEDTNTWNDDKIDAADLDSWHRDVAFWR